MQKYTIVKTHEKIPRITFVISEDIEKCIKFSKPIIFFKNIGVEYKNKFLNFIKENNLDDSNINQVWEYVIDTFNKETSYKITAIKITKVLREQLINKPNMEVLDISQRKFINAKYYYKDNQKFEGFDEIKNGKIELVEIKEKLFELVSSPENYTIIKINQMEHLKVFKHPFETQKDVKVVLHFHSNDNVWKVYFLSSNGEDKNRHMLFIGFDYWNRPVYKCLETGVLWKDITLGGDNPSLHNSSNNAIDGEPDCPILKDLKVIYINQYHSN